MIVILSGSMMMAMMMCCLCVIVVVLKKRKKSAGNTGNTTAASPSSGGKTPQGSTPEFKTSTYTGSVILSSPISAVKGLKKNADATVYGNDSDHKQILLPNSAPANSRALRSANRVYSRADAKKMLAVTLNDTWPIIKKYFGVEDWQKDRFLALLLGQATKESTMRVDIETPPPKNVTFTFGVNSAHAYGPLQTAVTAFKGVAAIYGHSEEPDVPEMKWYDWTAANFYDPMITNFMGIRKLCHFAIEAKNKYKATEPVEILRWALMGFNTGHANGPDVQQKEPTYWQRYPDIIAKMGEFYFKGKHYDNDVFTYTHNESGNATSYGVVATGVKWRENYKWFYTR
jgi:hypothetical protein